MSREIWNEGRVVGYSAYEIFVKHYYDDNPDLTEPVPSEKQWLASSIANGSAMLLKMPAVTTAGSPYTTVDIALPAGSHLRAGDTIYASFFWGDGHFASGSRWADRITDYGKGISNITASHPAEGEITQAQITQTNTKIPKQSLGADSAMLDKLENYMKIVDGILIQPGTWKESTKQPPEMDFEPNYKESPVLRLIVDGTIPNQDAKLPRILLTGFTIDGILHGVASSEGSTDTNHPADGDFLGPAVFPWANKVILTTPSAYAAHLSAKSAVYGLTYNNQTTESNTAGGVKIYNDQDTTGKKVLALSNSSGTAYSSFKGDSGTLEAKGPYGGTYYGKLTWDLLLEALANNKSIDVANILSAGTGISVSRGDTGKWTITSDIGTIFNSDHLKAGAGISIDRSGSGATASATIKHSNAVTAGTASGSNGNIAFGGSISIPSVTYDAQGHITAKSTTSATIPTIVPGPGISINKSSNSYKISNSLVDTSGWGDWLVQGTDYLAYDVNNFCSYSGGSTIMSPTVLGIKLKEMDVGDANHKGYLIKIQGTAEGDNNAMLGNANFTRNVGTDSSGFQFFHTGQSNLPYGRATVLIIKLLKYSLYDASLHDYSFTDTSDYMTGVWNIQVGGSTVGGSWGAVCKAFWIKSGASVRDTQWITELRSLGASVSTVPSIPFDPTNSERYLVVRADSYIDGYNNQLYSAAWCPSTGTISSNHINLNITGQFMP